MKKKQSTNFVSTRLQPSRDFIHRPQGSALRGKYCYIPNFAKCSLVPCSNSTPIPSPILIIISSVSILILTPFYHSPYESFLASFPTHAHILISAPYDYFSYLRYYDTLLLCFRLSHSVLSPNFYLTTVTYYLDFSLLINVIHLNTPLLLRKFQDTQLNRRGCNTYVEAKS